MIGDNSILKDQDDEVKEMLDLIEDYIPRIINFIQEGKQENKLINQLTVKELNNKLDLQFQQDKISKHELVNIIENVLKYSVNSFNPKFCDKLYSGTNPIGILSEWILSVLNANTHVYHVSPVLTQIEISTSKKLANLFGYNQTYSGGLTFPGGSTSNLMALLTARNLKYPNIKLEGYKNENLSLFTAINSHYSIDQSAASIGIGLNRVYKIQCNLDGTMNISNLLDKLNESINKKETPYFLNITAGTTVQGSFDNIPELIKVAIEYNLWTHLDASWGGSVIFSKQHKHLLKGSELVDSITINPHKLLGVPLQCSFLLLPNRLDLVKANALEAEYLFHQNNIDDNIDNMEIFNDLGMGTIACGRKPDAFKLYLAWKYYGTLGFETRINTSINNMDHLRSKILNDDRFQLCFNHSTMNCCFYYIPKQYKKHFDYINEDLTLEQLLLPIEYGQVTLKIHSLLRQKGKFMLDYSPLIISKGNNKIKLPPFFRMVANNPNLSINDVDILLEEILKCAKELNL